MSLHAGEASTKKRSRRTTPENTAPDFQVTSHHLADDSLVMFSIALDSAQRDCIFDFLHKKKNQSSWPC